MGLDCSVNYANQKLTVIIFWVFLIEDQLQDIAKVRSDIRFPIDWEKNRPKFVAIQEQGGATFFFLSNFRV